MKRTVLALAFILGFLPSLALAQAPSCSAEGYTVVFVNGIFDSYQQALADSDQLSQKIPTQYKSEPVTVQIGYNPSHLAGAGDLAQAAAQMEGGSISDFDLDTILMQIAPEVTTRKVLLVGHSQGALYTNELYDYLLAHGVQKNAIAVYNVASIATTTAGGGNYLNSSNDSALSFLNSLNFTLLWNNIDIPPQADDVSNAWPGHSFADAYLAGASDRIISDIQNELGALKVADGTPSDCFTPPDKSLGYNTQQAIFTVADPTALVLKTGTVVAYDGAVAVGKFTLSLAQALWQLLADSIIVTTSPHNDAQDTQKTFNITKKLYGSSLSPQDLKDLLGDSQGAAVAAALPPKKKGLVLGAETGPADATSTVVSTSTTPEIVAPSVSLSRDSGGATQTETPTAEVAATVVIPPPPILFDASTTAPTLSVAECADSLTSDFCFVPTQSVSLSWSDTLGAVKYEVMVNGTQVETVTATSTQVELADQATSTIAIVADDASGAEVTSQDQSVFVFEHPVVINEIEWAGDQVDAGREWLELKNRTPYTIDLSHMVIAAKDGGSQHIPLTGSISQFFVVERVAGAPLGAQFAEVQSFDQLADSGEQLALVWGNDSATATLDETPPIAACSGWCAGASVASSGLNATLSMERIDAAVSGLLPSNWASNDTYTASPNMPGGDGQALYATVLKENSLHWPALGFFCSPDKQSITPGQAYHPQSGACTALARSIQWPGPISAAIFKGDVGSSTLEGMHEGSWLTGSTAQVDADFNDAQPGDHYFVAIWRPYFDASLGGVGVCTNPMDDTRVPAYLTTGHWLARDGWCGAFTVDTTDPPNLEIQLIPFIYGQ